MENSNKPEIRFPGFDDDWEQRELGEVSNIVGGGTPSTNIPEYWGGDIDWYSPTEIGDNIYVSESKKKITELGFQKSSARILPEGTVLFTSRAGIGNTAILTKEGTTNQGFQSIIPKLGELDTYFLYSKTNKLKQYGEVNGSGSTFIEISGKQMEKMPLMLPKIDEQQQIGNFFKTLDDTIALHQRELEELKTAKKGFLQKMFPKDGENVPEIRFPGFTDTWEQYKLGEYTTLITKGTTPRKQTITEKVNFIKVENLKDGKIYPVFKISEVENDGPLKRSILNEGDILFSIAGTLGRVAIVDKSVLPANTNQALSIIRGYDFNPEFLIVSLAGRVVNEYIAKNPTIGAQPNLSLEQIRKLIIPTPNIVEQQKIGTFFKTLDDTIALHQQELDYLKETKKAFLQKMFV